MRGLNVSTGSFVPSGRFGRMFPNLAPADNSEDSAINLARKLGSPRGPMVGGGGWNFKIPAGFTYLGQFLDHDLTFDPTSTLERKNDPRAIRNFRTAAFELDSIYGSGPQGHPFFYATRDPKRFRLGSDEIDVPRMNDGTAVIADPRNDHNFFVSQLHVAFLHFHNYVVAQEEGQDGAFERAQRLVRWHYQWMIRHEYLPKIVDEDVITECVRGPRLFKWVGDPFIPVEFNVAAFRFGHSQIRASYDIREELPNVRLMTLFGPNAFRNVNRAVDWRLFFPLDPSPPQASRPIGPTLVEPLMNLPGMLRGNRPDALRTAGRSDRATGSVLSPEGGHSGLSDLEDNPEFDFEKSLAYLDIRRGQAYNLPHGASVAAAIRLEEEDRLEASEVWDDVNRILERQESDPVDTDTPVPLWLYILVEAHKKRNGERLGPVGGRIVSEVILGLLEGDSESYMAQDPSWKPTLGETAGDFSIVDLLRLAEEERTGRSRRAASR